ncbi:unnamed protein product [Musa acuminata subsp. burmannicoides]
MALPQEIPAPRNPVKSLVDYLMQVKALESRARMAYAEEPNMNSNDFLQMLLLDACFVLETITCTKSIKSTSWALRAVARDMLLLENQLPFFLLETLFDAAFPNQSVNLLVLVLNFIGRFVRTGKMEIASLSGSSHHLLHILHSCIIPRNGPTLQSGGDDWTTDFRVAMDAECDTAQGRRGPVQDEGGG